MDFPKILSDSKSLQVSRTLLSILTNLNSDVLWMVSIFPLISNSPSLFPRFLEIVTRVPALIVCDLSYYDIDWFGILWIKGLFETHQSSEGQLKIALDYMFFWKGKLANDKREFDDGFAIE